MCVIGVHRKYLMEAPELHKTIPARCPMQLGKSFQGGSGTEPEPETGTVGTVFPKPKAEPEPPEPFSRNRNRNRPFLLNCTEIQKNLFCRGTAGTENRNRLNRSIPKPQPNRTEPGPPCNSQIINICMSSFWSQHCHHLQKIFWKTLLAFKKTFVWPFCPGPLTRCKRPNTRKRNPLHES